MAVIIDYLDVPDTVYNYRNVPASNWTYAVGFRIYAQYTKTHEGAGTITAKFTLNGRFFTTKNTLYDGADERLNAWFYPAITVDAQSDYQKAVNSCSVGTHQITVDIIDDSNGKVLDSASFDIVVVEYDIKETLRVSFGKLHASQYLIGEDIIFDYSISTQMLRYGQKTLSWEITWLDESENKWKTAYNSDTTNLRTSGTTLSGVFTCPRNAFQFEDGKKYKLRFDILLFPGGFGGSGSSVENINFLCRSATKKAVLVINDSPSVPNLITIPDTIQSGKSIVINWGTSIDPDGNLSGYVLERQINGGSWTQVYKGGNRSFTDNVQTAWNTLAYRVCAYDSVGACSNYKTTAVVTVLHNTAPLISGTDAALGSFGMTAPTYDYTVTDEDQDSVTVTEKLDGIVLRTYHPVLGAANALALSYDRWLQVLNGAHTITITADDGKGGMAARMLTFMKNVSRIEFYLSPPLASSDMATKAIESVIREIPAGAAFTVEVCNNANDAAPAWEDVTQRVLAGQKIFLANTSKTAAEWAYNIRVTVERKNAAGDCWVSGGSGFFE